MAQPPLMQPVPLALDVDGVMRLAGARVTLDTMVDAFQEGATAEETVQQYPSLSGSIAESVGDLRRAG